MRLALLATAAAVALPSSAGPVPTPIGVGARYHPAPAALGPCSPGTATGRYRAHVELFANRRVVLLPPRIGLRAGCRTAVRTLDPTGVLHFDARGLTLADLFRTWGRQVAPQRLLSFRGPVSAWVDGRRVRGPVTAIPLHDRGQIVIEVGGLVPPHATYLFSPR